MITSVAMGAFGLVAALVGLQCSKAAGDNYVLKGRIAGAAGVLFLLQGGAVPLNTYTKYYLLQTSFWPLEGAPST